MGPSLIPYMCVLIVLMSTDSRVLAKSEMDNVNTHHLQKTDAKIPGYLFNSRLCREVKSKEKPVLETKLLDLSKGGQPFQPEFQILKESLQNATLRFKCSASYPVFFFIMGFEGSLNARLNTVISDDKGEKNATSSPFFREMDLDLPHSDYFKVQIKCTSVACRKLDHSSSTEVAYSGSSLKVFPMGFSGKPIEYGIKLPDPGPSTLVIILSAISPGIFLAVCIFLGLCLSKCKRELTERRILREQQREMISQITVLIRRHPPIIPDTEDHLLSWSSCDSLSTHNI